MPRDIIRKTLDEERKILAAEEAERLRDKAKKVEKQSATSKKDDLPSS